MRHYIARLLRRTANRLDPPPKPGEWAHVVYVNGQPQPAYTTYTTTGSNWVTRFVGGWDVPA